MPSIDDASTSSLSVGVLPLSRTVHLKDGSIRTGPILFSGKRGLIMVQDDAEVFLPADTVARIDPSSTTTEEAVSAEKDTADQEMVLSYSVGVQGGAFTIQSEEVLPYHATTPPAVQNETPRSTQRQSNSAPASSHSVSPQSGRRQSPDLANVLPTLPGASDKNKNMLKNMLKDPKMRELFEKHKDALKEKGLIP